MPVNGFRFYFTPLTGVLFTFPSRYSFAIGSCVVFRLGGWSPRILAGFHVPRHTQVPHQQILIDFAYGALTRSGRLFQAVLLPIIFCRVIPMRPYNPSKLVWPVPQSLAATKGISIDVFSRVTEMVQFTQCDSTALFYSCAWCTADRAGYPIRKSTGQRMFAPNRGLSQLNYVLHRLAAP